MLRCAEIACIDCPAYNSCLSLGKDLNLTLGEIRRVSIILDEDKKMLGKVFSKEFNLLGVEDLAGVCRILLDFTPEELEIYKVTLRLE